LNFSDVYLQFVYIFTSWPLRQIEDPFMMVRCPSCKTTYKVADELLRDAQPAFRCSRCKHIFELHPEKTRKQPARIADAEKSSLPKDAQEQELRFPFASQQNANGEQPKELATSPEQDSEFATRNTEQPSTGADKPAIDVPEISREGRLGTETATVPNFPEGVSSELSPSQPLPLARETIDNVLALDPYRDQPFSTAPLLTLVGLLVMFFGLATVFHFAHPNLTEGIVQSIPLLGPSVLKNNHLRTGVALQSLHARHQTIQGNREVLVVTGVAQNRNPVVIREVRVAGQLYNLTGKEIEQQTIWIGNAISPRIIRGMTAQDISDLQRLKPLKTFEIPPGDSIPFTIVFLKSTKEIKDFSCEVLTAESAA
jgi:predicted Zn finger-like uncharacterized protein